MAFGLLTAQGSPGQTRIAQYRPGQLTDDELRIRSGPNKSGQTSMAQDRRSSSAETPMTAECGPGQVRTAKTVQDSPGQQRMTRTDQFRPTQIRSASFAGPGSSGEAYMFCNVAVGSAAALSSWDLSRSICVQLACSLFLLTFSLQTIPFCLD